MTSEDSLILVLHSKLLLFANYGNGEAICKERFDYRESTLNLDSSRFASVPDPILPSWQYEETSKNQFTGSRHSFQLSRYAALKKRPYSLKRKGFCSLEKGCF
jgi:hypothetical protein